MAANVVQTLSDLELVEARSERCLVTVERQSTTVPNTYDIDQTESPEPLIIGGVEREKVLYTSKSSALGRLDVDIMM